MATREIKTTIALDGEQQFKKALADASREMRVMESEAKSLSAAYDANGDAASYFASRQQNLRNQIKQQEEIVSALEKAVKDSAETFGESSAQTDGWAIKLNNARTRLSKLQKQLDSADREVEELGRDSVKAGRQLEQGVGEGAEAAEKDVRSLIETMQQELEGINAATTISGVKDLWDMASGAFTELVGFGESTREYRTQLAMLAQNTATAEFDFSKVKRELIEVQGLTGEASTAVETLSNLLAIDEISTSQLSSAIDLLGGAVVKFPDTLKFESLADGLQETIAAGEATGAFAELLSRLGVDVEAFNTALAESDSTAGDLDIALAYLAQHGLADVYEGYRNTNAELVNANEKQAELELAMAGLGEKVDEYVTTPFTALKAVAATALTEAITEVEERLHAYAEEKGWTTDTVGTTVEFDPLGLSEERTFYQGDPAHLAAMGYDAKTFQAAGQEATQAFLNGMEMELDASLWNPELATPEAVLIKPVESAMQGWFETVREAAESLQEARDDFEREGEESSGAFADAFENRAQELISRTSILGRNAGTGFGAGLRSTVSYVNSAAAAVAAAARAGLSTAASGARNVILQVDGRELARTTATYYDAALSVAE